MTGPDGEIRFNIRADGGDDGTFHGDLSTYGNVDSYGTVCDEGCFDESVKAQGPVRTMLWQHDWEEPIGKIIVEDTKESLRIKGDFNLDVARAREAYSLVKRGDIDGLSMGFRVLQSHYDEDGHEHFTNLDLMEGSVVTFPANSQARIVRSKGGPCMPIDIRKRILKIDLVTRMSDAEKTELINAISAIFDDYVKDEDVDDDPMDDDKDKGDPEDDGQDADDDPVDDPDKDDGKDDDLDDEDEKALREILNDLRRR